jgi:hypothetical protein
MKFKTPAKNAQQKGVFYVKHIKNHKACQSPQETGIILAPNHPATFDWIFQKMTPPCFYILAGKNAKNLSGPLSSRDKKKDIVRIIIVEDTPPKKAINALTTPLELSSKPDANDAVSPINPCDKSMPN